MGDFTKKILRFPMTHDNQTYNMMQYNGNLPRTTRFISKDQMINMIDDNILEGLDNGRPVQLYRSGSYTTIGKYEDNFTFSSSRAITSLPIPDANPTHGVSGPSN